MTRQLKLLFQLHFLITFIFVIFVIFLCLQLILEEPDQWGVAAHGGQGQSGVLVLLQPLVELDVTVQQLTLESGLGGLPHVIDNKTQREMVR